MSRRKCWWPSSSAFIEAASCRWDRAGGDPTLRPALSLFQGVTLGVFRILLLAPLLLLLLLLVFS